MAGAKEDVEIEVDCFLSPPQYGVTQGQDPLWVTSAIPLNKIPVQADGNRLKIWECYKIKTGLFMTQPYLVSEINAQEPVNGPFQNCWAVGGQPITGFQNPNGQSSTDAKLPPFSADTPVMQLMTSDRYNNQTFSLNPWMDNSKYYINKQKGGGAYSFGDSNSQVTLLSDEWGWGIMCPSGFCYLAANDYFSKLDVITGGEPADQYQIWQPARYFTIYLRQRWVKSPVILMDMFEQMLNSTVKGFSGETNNIEEVQMGWGKERTGPEGMLHPSGITSGYSSGTMTEGTKLSEAPSTSSGGATHPNVISRNTAAATTLPGGCELHFNKGQKKK